MTLPLGARPLDAKRCEFRVWSPLLDSVELHIVAPREQRIAMTKRDDGYHEAVVECGEGTRYFYVIDGNDRPDPASRMQPEGVHGPSKVVGSDFEWHDDGWRGVPLEDYVVYELHVGTFTREGTFDAVISRLDELKDLGVTAVELLPVAQFPGTRNWGYDGVYMNAPQISYGGVPGLKRLVDACHQRGLALLLDVVYNHLGPEGNYLSLFAPYFTDRYKTPWGLALNFDGAYSDDVRWFFIHNALQWIDEFHIDGLRVDAVHAIVDHSAQPFLQDLTTAVRKRASELGRRIYTIAESDLNDPRVITPAEDFGLGFDAQWDDDFHHSLHAILTGESDGYYEGFGGIADFARVFERGYLFIGQHSAYRKRKYGERPKTTDGSKFVVFAQNHDQVGNRMTGDRLTALVPYDQLKLAAAAVVLSPFIPMLWMGEEYGEKSPFQYFTSHSDSDLIEAVRKGRQEEFDDFNWEGEVPDPHDEQTYERSKLRWERLEHEEHQRLRRLYRDLLQIRRETPALRTLDLASLETHADEDEKVLLIRRWLDSSSDPSPRQRGEGARSADEGYGGGPSPGLRPPSPRERGEGTNEALIAFNFASSAKTIALPFASKWKPLLDTAAKIEEQKLTLPPFAFAVFSGEGPSGR